MKYVSYLVCLLAIFHYMYDGFPLYLAWFAVGQKVSKCSQAHVYCLVKFLHTGCQNYVSFAREIAYRYMSKLGIIGYNIIPN